MVGPIVIDARKLGDGGIGVYLENLLQGLLELLTSTELLAPVAVLLPEKTAWQSEIRDLVLALSRHPLVALREEKSGKYSFAEYLLLSQRQKDILQTASVFHAPHYTLPFFLPCPAVVTIHDIIHLTHPPSRLHPPLAKALISSACRRAARVLTVSRESRRALEMHLSQVPHIDVIPNALPYGFYMRSDEELTKMRDLWEKRRGALPQSFFLFVGNDKPHKGLSTCIEACRLLGSENKQRASAEAETALVLVGIDPHAAQALFPSDLPILCFENLEREEMALLYGLTEALIVSSREEGFCLPILEALASGAPVVSTPVPAILEQFSDNCSFADSFSAASLKQAIEKILSDHAYRQSLQSVGLSHAKKFSVEEFARQTVRAYEAASGNRLLQALEPIRGVSCASR